MKKRKFYGDQPVKDLHILCTEREHQDLKAAAALAGFTLSRYCVRLLNTGKVEARLKPTELKLLRDVANVGNNINQIAKKLNSLETDRITIAMAEEAIGKIHLILDNVQNSKTKL